jgi:hypothetical protein
MPDIDFTITRRKYQVHDTMPTVCPECSATLVRASQGYLLAARDGREPHNRPEPYLTVTDKGRFCLHCPVAVLDAGGFRGLAVSASLWDIGNAPIDWAVLGMVAVAALPSGESDAPLGRAGNPLPFIAWLPPLGYASRGVAPHAQARASAPSRNDPCPCGSGRKYKRCCLHREPSGLMTTMGSIDPLMMRVEDEVAYIRASAMARSPRIVTLGALQFLATDTGDAWVFDPAERRAARLMAEGAPRPVAITETVTTYAVAWQARYTLHDDAVTIAEPDGGVVRYAGPLAVALAEGARHVSCAAP